MITRLALFAPAALIVLACGAAETETVAGASPTSPIPENGWFTEIGADVGLRFRHAAGIREDYHAPEIMGSGAALFDYDGDGDLDVYLVNGGAGDSTGSVNRMFRQEADGSFTDVTEPSGLGDPGYGMGCALGDVDNDGDLDLFVTNFGPDVLYLNAGGGRFRAASDRFDDELWSTSACFLDYDGDGWLDLYVATYLDFDPPKACTDKAGNPEFCGPEAFRGLPDRLYRNAGGAGGRATFTDAAALAGRPSNKGLGVICADFDGDALVDVYVANDGEPNQLWLNRGDRSFEDRALILGAAVNLFSQPEASMGVTAADVDGDLDLDLFMTHLDRETNTLYLNLGEDGFEDRTAVSGLGPAGLPYTGFGAALFDADHDGDLDLVAVNGRVRRGASLAERAQRSQAWRPEDTVPPLLHDYAEPNLFFLNDGGGSFRDASATAGRLASAVEVSRGVLPGDLDDDGDLDLLVTNCGGSARLYRNDVPGKGHWLKVRAIDPALNRDALGAMVEVRAGERSYVRPVITTYSYLSAGEPEVHFGLGDAVKVDAITVMWPDGTREEFPGGEANRAVEVLKGQGTGI